MDLRCYPAVPGEGRRLCWMVASALVAFSWSARADADLATDVRTLAVARAAYGQVVQLKPRLLERGERLQLPIPPELLDPKSPSCATVSILGVPGLHFVVRFSEFDPGAPSSAFPELSVNGASEVTRCGSSKPYLAGIFLELRSPRGLIETLISSAPASVPRLLEVLPQRDPGSELALGDPGPRPVQPSLKERLRQLSARAARDRAASYGLDLARASADGTGALPLLLTAACHELTLLNDDGASAPPATDLDMELVEHDTGSRLAMDRADDADSALGVCVGAPTAAELRFVGARPAEALTLAHAAWELPIGLSGSWGAEPRARLAKLARAQHFAPRTAPIYSSLGVQGTTELPLEVEPGACYSVLLAPLRGEVRSLSLSAVARAPGETPRGSSDPDGAAVSFCARGARRATLEVTGDGVNLAWLLAVWESGRASIGVGIR